jgi:tripartite-type tricarboxylate transporter receptor subunit TctC
MKEHGMKALSIGLASLGIAAAFAAPASAESVEAFYKANAVTIVVGSGAGGGYDTYTRVLARTIPKYIPGHPRIVVQNMPGASGIKALNHIYAQAPRDGSVFSAAANTMPLDPLFGGPASKFDPFKLNWIGSIGKQVNVCVAWAAGPFKSLDDAIAREMKVSATGNTGWRAMLPRMYNALAGTKFKVIQGYETTASMLAVERGEVDGTCTTYETLAATQADWIQHKKVRFLAQFGATPIAGLEDVPNGLDRIKNPLDLKAFKLITLQEEFGRPYVAPPEIPAERREALRTAFDRTMKDAGFLAEAKKTGMMVEPMTGAEIDAVLKEAYAAPKNIVERGKEILDRASK